VVSASECVLSGKYREIGRDFWIFCEICIQKSPPNSQRSYTQ
jgi:hypothetical protein